MHEDFQTLKTEKSNTVLLIVYLILLIHWPIMGRAISGQQD